MTIQNIIAVMVSGKRYNASQIARLSGCTTGEADRLLIEARRAGKVECRHNGHRTMYWLSERVERDRNAPRQSLYERDELQAAHTLWGQFRRLCEVSRPSARPDQVIRHGLLSQSMIEGERPGESPSNE